MLEYVVIGSFTDLDLLWYFDTYEYVVQSLL